MALQRAPACARTAFASACVSACASACASVFLSALAWSVALGGALGGCATAPTPAPGLMDVAERPAERALLAGMRAYDDAQYAQAERQLDLSLEEGLAAPRDRAAALKHLAFIYCTTNRIPACEAAFRAARASDPAFALSKSEAGHPQWGPVYQRLRQ